MESCSVIKPTRQLMAKGKRQEGQANRETRAFVAMRSRKMLRRSGIEKKRGLPLLEISANENEAHSLQDQSKKGKGAQSTKRVDHVKEALKKWQKEKRLRQIQEKNRKKAPFRISQVSYRASEFPHSFQNNIANEINSTKIQKMDITKMVPQPKQASAQKNSAVTKKTKPLNSGRDKETGTTGNKPSTKSACQQRTMKTRSMARTTSTKNSICSSNTSAALPMETDDISTSQITTCTQDLPGRVTRSRTNENEAIQTLPSLISNDFSFNAPDGVTSFVFCRDQFTFTPLSPKSAQKFFPTRSPLVESQNKSEQKCHEKNSAAGQQKVRDFDAVSEPAALTKDSGENETNKPVLDTTYFRNLANSEIDRLKCRCAHWESESEQVEVIPEEVKGMIRTVTGQVQLLVTKKFKQFSGLLDLSEDPKAEKRALVSDLQGFWEMMYIQVEDIDKKFEELEQLKENNWEKKQLETKKKNVKRTTKGKKNTKTANPKVSESRNKFREMRAQMKAKLQAEKNEEQDAFKIIFTPVKNKKADTDPSEPEIILTPVRRSTRKSRGCASMAVPLVNLPNISVDLFGACKTPETVETNECLSNLDDSMFRPRHPQSSSVQFPTSDDLMVFSPTTPAKN